MQLPHDVRGFTGRHGELDRLQALVTSMDPAGTAIVIAAIDGAAGVGKTALAVHFGHQNAGRFPDGQLYVDLRGFDPHQPPLPSREALHHVLDCLGVHPQQIPADLDKQVAMFRSTLAGKHMLVLLDNAVAADQVRPLLPASATCFVLVTSRNRLSGLVARDGACRITLPTLPPDDAVALLTQIIGRERVAAEPHAAQLIAEVCGYLPLALRITAERLAARAHAALSDIVVELTDQRQRLDTLTADGDEATAVRAVFSWSFHTLDPDAARMFRLLGLHAGPDISTPAAAALAGVTVDQARALLDILVGRHLVEETRRDRYWLHDLLRLYAVELAADDESEQNRATAIRRVLTWYLHTAHAAGRVLMPHHRHLPLIAPEAACAPLRFATPAEALEWCETERADLVAATDQAAQLGHDTIAWRLPMALWSFFVLRKPMADWTTTTRVGLAAAERLHDQSGQAHTLTSLANAYHDLHRFDDAVEHYQRALTRWWEIDDLWGEAGTRTLFGLAYQDLHQVDNAVDQFTQALALFRLVDDQWGQGWNLYSLGRACQITGRFHQSIAYLHRALALFRDIGDRWGQSWVLCQLGNGYWRLRQPDDALDHYEQALTICQDVGNRQGEGYTLIGVANAYRAGRLYQKAIDYYHRALTLLCEIGDRSGEAETLYSLGKCLHDTGQIPGARERWTRAFAIFDNLGHPRAADVRSRLHPPRQQAHPT